MVIFHSYVSLPEGTVVAKNQLSLHLRGFDSACACLCEVAGNLALSRPGSRVTRALTTHFFGGSDGLTGIYIINHHGKDHQVLLHHTPRY